MRKVNTKGINNTSKVMLMAGMTYNQKKYLKFKYKGVQIQEIVYNGWGMCSPACLITMN